MFRFPAGYEDGQGQTLLKLAMMIFTKYEKIKEGLMLAGKALGYELAGEEIVLERPNNSQYGDLSTNIAMILAKKNGKNPVDLAKNIVDNFQKDLASDIVEKVEVAGEGFINFYFSAQYLKDEAEKINFETEFRQSLAGYGRGKTLVVDYSAPNIAKPFGIGHLRSTVIGQAIYNLYAVLGWKCVGDNHLGDWGSQFGKLIVAIKKWGEKQIDNLTIDDLEKLYVRFHQEEEINPELTEEARDWFVRLEGGDKEAISIWQKCVATSMAEFDRIYQMLDIKIDMALGESFYEKMLPTVIEEIKRKGIARESQGALIVEFDDMPPAMLKKSNGTTTYFARDMATVRYRINQWSPDLIVYEVGAEHELHFKQIFSTAEKMGWRPSEGFVHVGHGMFRSKEGKFSTRKGKTIHLSEVIDRALIEAENLAQKSRISAKMTAKEKKKMLLSVAVGAIKFNDLISNPKKDIVFDWKKVMNLEGDSGPYLQYTYARCLAVLKKSRIVEQKDIEMVPADINSEERVLLSLFCRFEEKMLIAAQRFNPSILAEFLVLVARKYNEFYDKHRIIDQKEETFRVFLTKTTASCLKFGLRILGVQVLDKM